MRPAPSLLFLLTALAAPALAQTPLPDSLAPALPAVLAADTLPVRALLNVATQLSGVAGVQVTPAHGEPGAWSTIRIRGLSTLAAQARPLIVVDGLPMLNADFAPQQQAPGDVAFDQVGAPRVGGTGASPLLGLPVADIASVEVLKGAAATAAYGSQGANGVLLISTRRGGQPRAAQPLRAHYDGWGGVQQVRQHYALLDAQNQIKVHNELAAAGFIDQPISFTQEVAVGAGTDWQATLLRPAAIQSHTLSVDGSTARTSYRIAAGVLRQAGVVRYTDLARNALSADVQHHLNARLSVFGRAILTSIERDRATRNDLERLALTSPLLPVRNADGSYFSGDPLIPTNPFAGPPLLLNALARAEFRGSREHTRRLLSQAGLHWQLTHALQVQVQSSHERSTVTSDSRDFAYDNARQPLAASTPTGNRLREVTVTNVQARLLYIRPAAGPHQLRASLTALWQQQRQALRDSASVAYYGTAAAEGSRRYTRTQRQPSLTAQARYVYKQRYELQASLRAEAASDASVGTTAPAALYAGAEATWHLLAGGAAGPAGLSRAAVAVGAGQSHHNNLFQGVGIVGFAFDNLPGVSIRTPGRTTQVDATLHLGWLADRVRLTLGAYRRYTADADAGTTSFGNSPTGPFAYTNIVTASIINHGLEATASADYAAGRLRGSTRVAAALQRNELDDVRELNPPTQFGLPDPLAGYPVRIASLATFQGLDAQGLPRYATTQQFGRDFTTYTRQGNGLPRTLLGLTQQLHYGRFDLNAQLDALLGYQLYDATQAALNRPRPFGANAATLLDRWTPANPNTTVPVAPAFLEASDHDLADASHLRLTQLTLGYEVYARAARRVAVWVGGQNLLVLTSYRGPDPNVSSGGSAPQLAGFDTGSYPMPRSFLVGIKGSF